MNYHRLSQGTEWAVLAAVLVLHAVVLAPFPSQADAAWLQIAADAQPLAAIVLLLAWGIMGPGWLWCRVVAVPLLLFVIGTQGDGYGPFIPAPVPFTLPFAVAIAAILLLISMRLSGLRATRSWNGGTKWHPQFSIRSLLVTTTLIAVVIGFLEILRDTVLVVSPEMEYDQLVRWLLENQAADRLQATARQCVLSAAVAACTIAALAAVLRPGSAWLRLAILVVAITASGAYLTHLVGEPADSFAVRAVEMITALAVPAILVAVSALPLRLMGYRLCRPTPRAGLEPRTGEPSPVLARLECGPTVVP